MNPMKLAFADCEYNRPSEPDMGILSATIHTQEKGTQSFWLHDDARRKEYFIKFLESMKTTHVLCGYTIHLAEARCLAALGLDPNEWKWRDLHADMQWLRNETNESKYGPIVKNDLAYFTVPPARHKQKRMTAEEIAEVEQANSEMLDQIRSESDENVSIDEAAFSLLDVLYFFQIITIEEYREMADTKRKIRDQLIVTGTIEEILARKDEILAYNASDIKYIEKLAAIIDEKMEKAAYALHMKATHGQIDYTEIPDVRQVQLGLGDWCARTAKYAHRGIPINKARLERFLQITPQLTKELEEQWNRNYPHAPIYRVGLSETMLMKRKTASLNSPYVKASYTRDQQGIQGLVKDYCREYGIDNWPQTPTGGYSTDKRTLATFANGENLIKQLERHFSHLSNLKAFSKGKDGKIEALSYIGGDMRQRPDFGPHGTQTDRNAHKAKSCVLAMTHWMRILADPEPGMAFVECDYSSEEVFISAALANDVALMDAYLSQDFYMTYAQLSGMYPKDLPVPSEAQRNEAWFAPYAKIRKISKALCLSIQYGARYKSIAHAIALATGDSADYDASWALVEEYHQTFADQAYMVEQLRQGYQKKMGILLQNGWRLGPDNPSILSALNVPVQGGGACILQEACRLIDAMQIQIIGTMHDSITAYCEEEYAEAIGKCMQEKMIEASENVLGVKGMKVGMPEIIRHGEPWIHGDKAKTDWEKYKKYFED